MLIVLAAPQSASAQAPSSSRPCAAGEKEQVTKQTFSSGVVFFDFFFRTVVVTQTTTVTTHTNYKNVTGLIYILTERADGTKTEAFSFPAYLQQAYGGNLEAIKQDLRAGYLHDRGAC
jgi:hypothetical protein